MISLNLLPPDQQRRIRLQAQLQRWQGALTILIVLGLVGNASAIMIGRWLSQHHQLVRTQLQAIQSGSDQSSAGKVTQQIRRLNATLEPLDSILPVARDWSTDVVTWLNSLPPNVQITEFHLSLLGDLELKGVAPTRASFLELDTFMKQHPRLENVATDSLPNKPENLPFVYTAQLTTTTNQ